MDKSTEFMQPPVSAFHTTTYDGLIKQYYGDSLLQECPIIITYDNSIGTFKTKTLHLFFTDSLRITTIEGGLYSGYLFPDDICFDTAWHWAGENLLHIHFEIAGNILTGKTASDWMGYWYSFNTRNNYEPI